MGIIQDDGTFGAATTDSVSADGVEISNLNNSWSTLLTLPAYSVPDKLMFKIHTLGGTTRAATVYVASNFRLDYGSDPGIGSQYLQLFGSDFSSAALYLQSPAQAGMTGVIVFGTDHQDNWTLGSSRYMLVNSTSNLEIKTAVVGAQPSPAASLSVICTYTQFSPT